MRQEEFHRIILFFCLSCGTAALMAPDWVNAAVDNTLYAELLAKYVKNGVVNYQGFKEEEDKLDRYLQILEGTNTESLSHNEQFAFYINAYNAWTIKLVLTGYPGIESIKDLGGFFTSPWKKSIARIDGKVLTLDQIENDILRPRFADPRVHFAINCASKSCPPSAIRTLPGRYPGSAAYGGDGSVHQ